MIVRSRTPSLDGTYNIHVGLALAACRSLSRSTIGGGGDVINVSPYWEGTARK